VYIEDLPLRSITIHVLCLARLDLTRRYYNPITHPTKRTPYVQYKYMALYKVYIIVYMNYLLT